MKRAWLNAAASLLCLLLWLAAPVRAEVLTIGGTGSSGPLVQLLFDAYRQQAPGVSLHIIDPPMGTNGALKALEQGRIDMVLVGRPLSPEEYARFGENFSLADTPFVMASRDGLRPQGFTLEELAAVYEGALQQWDTGAAIRLVLRGSFESDTLLLKSMSPQLAKAVDKAGAREGMAGAVNDLATARLIANTPNALGPTTLGLLTTLGLKLKTYPLNGVAPTLSNLRNGAYPWSKNLSVILPRHPSAAASGFAAFLRTPRARSLMEANDYLPAAQ